MDDHLLSFIERFKGDDELYKEAKAKLEAGASDMMAEIDQPRRPDYRERRMLRRRPPRLRASPEREGSRNRSHDRNSARCS